MRNPRFVWALPVLLLITCLMLGEGWVQAASRNLAPDALSRATIWNSYTGELAALNDGLVPPGEAAVFFWHTKGILTFSWEGEVPLEKVRLYVGEIGNDFQLRCYRGGQLDETGAVREPEGQRTGLVEDHSRLVNAWVEIPFAEGVVADNIEVRSLGSVEIYEVEIYARTGGTPVEPLSWGQAKARRQ